ncbi:asparagine synthase (glutamine-hydrolyzing) [Flavitalea sp.]|nr:asparagine synthase (glutamine-hydrolyzing) [Flavitalea sp.]
MCGIVGSINCYMPDETVQLIRHRGPDEFGAREMIINNHVVRLFHHRLSILDLSANGSQPMESSDGQGIIIFNGEIYNHAELRELMYDLPFRGHSDTETLVNLCRLSCTEYSLSQLNGIFAFAYLDIENQKLYLVRDRFGVKPLYYYFEEGKVIFSSEIRPIVDRIRQVFSTSSITSALALRHVPGAATLFKNIFKVEPGQYIEINIGDSLSLTKKYFADLDQRKVPVNTTSKQLVTEYGQLLEKAVERQLLSDVEVGILLSGGVDSSLIAAIARSKVKSIKAFTVGFDDKELDERENARITAAYLNLDHYCAEVKFGNFLNQFEQIVNIVEEPVDSGSILSMYTLSKLASSKVKVVLSGQGADEPLGGYRKYKALPVIELLSSANFLQGFFRFCSRHTGNQNLRRILSTSGTSDDLYAYFEFNSLFGNHDIAKLLNKQEAEWISSNHDAAVNCFHESLSSRRNLPNRRSSLYPYLDTRTKLPETLLKYTDKITMHFALECRVPMLDNDLVAFIESLPRANKFGFKNSKIIHKTFAKEYLPGEMIHRKKLAFHAPSKSYLKNHSKEIKEWFVINDNKLFWRIFDRKKILGLVNEHAQFGNREKELILIMSTYFLTAKRKEPVHI